LAAFADRFRLKRQLCLDAQYEFLNLTVFMVLRALLLVCLLACHADSFPQGYLWIQTAPSPFRLTGLALSNPVILKHRLAMKFTPFLRDGCS